MRHKEDTISGLQLDHEQLLRSGLRSGFENRKLSATAERNQDGRTVRGLHSTREGSVTCFAKNRHNFSGFFHLGLPHVTSRYLEGSRRRLMLIFLGTSATTPYCPFRFG